MFVLNGKDVRAALPMADCIAAVRDGLIALARGESEQFARFQLKPTSDGPLMGLMPVFRGGKDPAWCVKDVLVAPDNRVRGLDTHQGAILVHDGTTGELLALVDASAITALRTAATSAVATLALARKDSRRIAVVGGGTQARAHVAALRLVLPQASIVLWAREADQPEQVAESLGVACARDIESAVAGADIVCTTTASREPLLKRGWIAPGCHINAVGASSPSSREIGTDIVAASEFFVDSRAQALTECGELLLPIGEGAIDATHIRAEIGDVLAGAHPGRLSTEAVTLFKSLGMAVEDMAATLRAVANARDMGLGQHVIWRPA
ncbi:MAG: ornithine cyclodeaminase family protein [Alphaproteobacteria bacterium]|nr:ornithine cyclodeaminase family protein [Alphaproteobacteria bacterium]